MGAPQGSLSARRNRNFVLQRVFAITYRQLRLVCVDGIERASMGGVIDTGWREARWFLSLLLERLRFGSPQGSICRRRNIVARPK